MAALKKLEKVSARLEENQQYLQKEFENAMDFMMRELSSLAPGPRCSGWTAW